MLARIANLVLKEIVQLLRDRTLLAAALLVPLVQMTLLGYAGAAGIRNLPTAVYDLDHTPASRRLIATLQNSTTFHLTTFVNSDAMVGRLLDTGAVQAVFVIPQGFSAALSRPDGHAQVQLLLDGTNTLVAGMAQSDALAIVSHFLVRERRQWLEGAGLAVASSVEAEPRMWFNPDLRTANFYIPGQLGAILSFLIIVLSAISIVRERELGTLEQLLVTPLRSVELLLGKAMPALLATYVEFIGLLLIALFWFRVPCHGSLGAFMAFCAFYIVVEMGWGLLISSISATQGQALMAAFFLNSLSMILSGYILPTEYMPRVTQLASHFLPLRYFVIVARGIFLRGSSLSEFTPQLASLALLGLALYSLGTWRLRSTVG